LLVYDALALGETDLPLVGLGGLRLLLLLLEGENALVQCPDLGIPLHEYGVEPVKLLSAYRVPPLVLNQSVKPVDLPSQEVILLNDQIILLNDT